MAIKVPFGEALNVGLLGEKKSFSFATAAGRKQVDIDAAVFFISSPSASRARELRVDADANLPVGAMLHIQHFAGTGVNLVLGTGFVGASRMAKTTGTKGTGNWYQSFTYNGTGFLPITDQFLKKA